MLFKNGERVELEQKQINSIYRDLHLPIRLVYPDELIKPNRLNIKPDKPNSINIPCKVNLKTVHGAEEWRYAENVVRTARGDIKYTPNSIPFYGDMMLTKYHIEFIWFIFHLSPYCKNGALEAEQRKRPYCEIEDEVSKAEMKARYSKLVARVNTMLYEDPPIGLSEERLRLIAKAYFIRGVDDLTVPQIQVSLEEMIQREEKMKKNGLQRFINLSGADALLETKGKIQTAIEKKIIKFNSRSMMWSWLDKKGKPERDICRITGGAEPYEAFHDFMMGDAELAAQLDDFLKGAEVVGAETETIPGPGGAEKVE